MSRTTKIFIAVVVAGAALCVTYPVWYLAVTSWRVRHANPSAVLAGCREMIANRDSYQGKRTDWPADRGVYIDFTVRPVDRRIPKVIQGLHPGYAIIESNSVLVVFLGGFSHLGYQAFAEGVEGSGTEKLADGLWLIHD
jgi:hypothetical protein